MKRLASILALVIVSAHLQGCFIVYYTGMPVVYDSVRLTEDQILEDIPYAAFGETDPKGRLDLFLPSSGRDWPLLIFVHGGGWSAGDKDFSFGGKKIYLNIGRYFASRGIASAVINYRLLPGVHWETQINDVAAAANWVYENAADYGANPELIFLSGHSAGAQLAAHVALNPKVLEPFALESSTIDGVIAVSGAGYDILDEETNRTDKMMNYIQKRYDPVDTSGNWKRDASVLQHVSSEAPPFMIFVGGGEMDELIRQSQLLKDKLDEYGVENTFEIVPGRRHARMILLMSGNGNGVAEDIAQFVFDRSRDAAGQ